MLKTTFPEGGNNRETYIKELLELTYKVLFGQYNVKVKCFHATFLETVLTYGLSCPKGK